MTCCTTKKRDTPLYRHRVDFIDHDPTGEHNPTGTPVTEEVVVLRTRAEVIPLVPSQQVQSDQQTGLLRYRIRIPFSRKAMTLRHEMLARILSNAFPGLPDLELDGPPSNEEGESRVVRVFAVQRQRGTT